MKVSILICALFMLLLAAGNSHGEEDIGFRLATNENDDDTPEIETETTVDYTQAKTGLKFDGDLRLFFNYFDREGRDGPFLGRAAGSP